MTTDDAPADRASRDDETTAAVPKQSPPSWSVTMIRTPAPPATTPSPRQQRTSAPSATKAALSVRGRNSVLLLAIAAAVAVGLFILVTRRGTPG